MADLGSNKRDWEDLAELDPMWAIASGQRFGGWDEDAFFASGDRAVDRLMQRLEAIGRPAQCGAALDFGCGLGRTTRGLAARFERVVGIDISRAMVDEARRLNAGLGNLDFVVNDAADLRVVGDQRFDLVYTRVVLQHVAGRELARAYVQEFMRLLAPGGVAAFQIPVHIPRRYRFMPVRRLYRAGRALGLPSGLLYRRLRLHPIRMQWVPEVEIASWVHDAGGRIVAADHKTSSTGIRHATFYATSSQPGR